MKRLSILIASLILIVSSLQADAYSELTKNFSFGKADIQSMSVLTFGPEGLLFVGDATAGKIFAIDLKDRASNTNKEGFSLENVEAKLASLLGTTTQGVVIHDFAVNPISQNIYLAVSRSDAKQLDFWKLPNDIGAATILLKIDPKGNISEVKLDAISFDTTVVPKVIDAGEKTFRKSDKRTEAITDIAYDKGKLYVTGLSNEAFASSLRILDFPFTDQSLASTLEVWHIAHGKSETEAPIRTLLPYDFDGETHILASYTCTPFVSFPVKGLTNDKHLKVKTLAEFGFSNMPIDIIRYRRDDKDYILMSNTSKALIKIDPSDIPNAENISRKLEDGEYTVGLPHDVLSRIGITHIDNYNAENVLVLQRMPNGLLSLRSYANAWL